MARLKASAELEALRQQQIELAKKIKEAEAKERERQKTEAERRERIAGRILLAHLASDPNGTEAKAIRSVLDATLIKPADRELFAPLLLQEGAAPTKGGTADNSPAPSAATQAVEQTLSFAESVSG